MLNISTKYNTCLYELEDPEEVDYSDIPDQATGLGQKIRGAGNWFMGLLRSGTPNGQLDNVMTQDEIDSAQAGAKKIGQVQNGLVSAGRAVAPILAKADQGLYNDDSLGDRDTTQRVPYAKIGQQLKDGLINLSNQADKGLHNDDNLGVRDTTQRVPYAKLAGQIRTALDQSHQGLHNDDSLGDRDTTQRVPYAKIGTRIKNILDQSHQGLHAEDPAEGNGAKLVTPVEAAKSIGAKLQNLKFSSSAPTPAPTPAPKPAPAPAPAAPAPNSPWYQDTWNWMTAHPGYTALGAGVPLALAGAYMWNKARKNKNAGQQA